MGAPATPGPQALVVRLRAAGCVFAEDEAQLLAEAADGPELERLVARRVAGEPLEVVLGWAAFAGLRVLVEPGVFVPRRRTEFLVEQALTVARPGALVGDLCCGSGAVAAALLAAGRRLQVHAGEIDPVAVRCAQRNVAPRSGVVHLGDLWNAFPAGLRGRFDVVVANAPYVPTDEIALMPPEAREQEPGSTLDGGSDGLDVARRIVASAAWWLRPGGRLLIETSRRQAPVLRELFAAHGLRPAVHRSEAADATVVSGAHDPVPAGSQVPFS